MSQQMTPGNILENFFNLIEDYLPKDRFNALKPRVFPIYNHAGEFIGAQVIKAPGSEPFTRDDASIITSCARDVYLEPEFGIHSVSKFSYLGYKFVGRQEGSKKYTFRDDKDFGGRFGGKVDAYRRNPRRRKDN